MREYANKKNEIIRVSRKLFYEKGYDATSLDAIATECGIVKSLINYHFGSKYDLARTVLNTYLREIKNLVAIKTYVLSNLKDVQISTAVEMYLVEIMYRHDEHANRFYIEMPIQTYSQQYTKIDKMRYEQHDRQGKLHLDRQADEISMIAVSAHAALHALHCAYYNDLFDCTFEQYLTYNIKLPYVLMKVDPQRLNAILAGMHKIIEKLDYKILPYFTIE